MRLGQWAPSTDQDWNELLQPSVDSTLQRPSCMRLESNCVGFSSTCFFIAKFKVTVETKTFVSDVKHFCHGIKLM